MILGMTTATLTVVHVVLSLIGSWPACWLSMD